MVQGEAIFQCLYVSELAPGCGFEVMKEIAATARDRNSRHGLTGALLFDGERFCQLIEGPQGEVETLMQRIEPDRRHVDVQRLSQGESPTGRRLQRWTSGYCDPHVLGAFCGVDQGLRGQPAVDAFLSVLKGADME